MARIEIKMTDRKARELAYYLRQRYGATKRTPLAVLIKLAAMKEAADQAQKDADNLFEKLDAIEIKSVEGKG